jgi:hypothetical protein
MFSMELPRTHVEPGGVGIKSNTSFAASVGCQLEHAVGGHVSSQPLG